MQLVFDSLADFAHAAKDTQCDWSMRHAEYSWSNGLYHNDAYSRCLVGDDSIVARAETLLEKINSASGESTTMQWTPSPYGAYPIVAEYLTGMPTPMRCRVPQEDENTPVGIWVDLTCSGGISTEQMFQRGIAIVALLMKLQQFRPVDLYLTSAYKQMSDVLTIRVNSRPIDLTSMGFALCNAAFVRHLCYGYTHAQTGWSPISKAEDIRAKTCIPPNDLVIPGAHLMDSTVYTDPVKWINTQLLKYSGGEGK